MFSSPKSSGSQVTPSLSKTLKPAARTKGQYTPSDIISVWASSTDPCQRGNLSSWPMAIPEAQTEWRAGEAFKKISDSRTSDLASKNIINHARLFFYAARGSARMPQVLPKSPHTTDRYWLAGTGPQWLEYHLRVGQETCQQIPGLQQMTITARPWNLTESQNKRITFQAPFLQVLHVSFKDLKLWEGVSNIPNDSPSPRSGPHIIPLAQGANQGVDDAWRIIDRMHPP